MDGAVAYAAVEHVAWEARIKWGESSDEASEGEPERAYRASAPGNAYLDAGDWAGAVRWGGDGESDDERRGGAAAGAGAGASPSEELLSRTSRFRRRGGGAAGAGAGGRCASSSERVRSMVAIPIDEADATRSGRGQTRTAKPRSTLPDQSC